MVDRTGTVDGNPTGPDRDPDPRGRLPEARRPTEPAGGDGDPPAGPTDYLVPAGFGLVLDRSVRIRQGGRVLVGGTPGRWVRLSGTGARVVARWLTGAPVGPRPSERRLARRLLDGGLVHPRLDPVTADPGPDSQPTRPAVEVTVVVPCRDDPRGLHRTLAAVAALRPGPAIPTVVVDDGSRRPAEVAAVAARHGAQVRRRPRPGGPSAARNTGLESVSTATVLFADCDISADADTLAILAAHLDDPAVVAVAPRLRPRPEIAGVLAAYEAERFPLDLGPDPARVIPHGRVAYVPSTFLLAKTAAVRAVAGFDDRLRFGEDVDLVWRLTGAGHTVRYEPAAVVTHPPRASWAAWLRQRFDYGTSAAPLDRRHPGSVAPLVASPFSAAAWGLVVAGHPVAGAAVTGAATVALARRLGAGRLGWSEAARWAGGGTLAAWRPLAGALVRSWWPVAAVAAGLSRRARPVVAAAVAATIAADWIDGDRHLDPVRFAVAHLADDLAYGAGVWAGCWRHGAWSALRPRWSPGSLGHPRPSPG